MSPKQRIVQNKVLADEIKAMLNNPRFEMACEAALFEIVETQPFSAEGAGAIAGFYMQRGAVLFKQTLEHIADTPAAYAPKQFGQLDHEMKPPEKPKAK